jgi:hypothetical protein
MVTYEFTLELKGSPELTEEVADRLFGAGCDDGSPKSCNGVVSIDFHRRGSSLQGAIASAMRDVRAAGFAVERITIDAASFPLSPNADWAADTRFQRFSIAELLMGVAALAIGFAWPVMLPTVAALFLIRAGVGLVQTVLIVLLGFPIALWFIRHFPW